MSEQTQSTPKQDPKQTSPKPEKVTKVKIRLGDADPIEVEKPSAEYNNLVLGYGYEEA